MNGTASGRRADAFGRELFDDDGRVQAGRSAAQFSFMSADFRRMFGRFPAKIAGAGMLYSHLEKNDLASRKLDEQVPRDLPLAAQLDWTERCNCIASQRLANRQNMAYGRA